VLVAAELSAVALVWTCTEDGARDAARHYFAAIVVGTLCVGVAEALFQTSFARIAVALLVLGFGLKLGLVPFTFWLPQVAARVPVMTSVLIISVLDIAAFGELVSLRTSYAWVFDQDRVVWLAVGLVGCFGGAVLALAQTRLKVLLAYSSIQDIGQLIVALLAAGEVGMSAVWLGLISHALCKLVLFGSVGVAEQGIGGALTLEKRGLLGRYPVAGAAFIAGAFGFVGIPPTLGFVGHWQVYLAGAEFGGALLLAALIAASIIELLYYVRAIHAVWLGPADPSLTARPVVRLASTVTLVFALAIVVLGVAPSLLGSVEMMPPLVGMGSLR
jgi:NADH:ubiquinone oxidoreductase subunit 2 (subunit N)